MPYHVAVCPVCWQVYGGAKDGGNAGENVCAVCGERNLMVFTVEEPMVPFVRTMLDAQARWMQRHRRTIRAWLQTDGPAYVRRDLAATPRRSTPRD